MELVYDRVKDFCPKCIYCMKIYLNRELLAYHFLTQHVFNKIAKVQCPHCNTLNSHIIAHVENFHKEQCLLCGREDADGTHVACTNYVKLAIKNYFQKKISSLFNMLEGLENI